NKSVRGAQAPASPFVIVNAWTPVTCRNSEFTPADITLEMSRPGMQLDAAGAALDATAPPVEVSSTDDALCVVRAVSSTGGLPQPSSAQNTSGRARISACRLCFNSLTLPCAGEAARNPRGQAP